VSAQALAQEAQITQTKRQFYPKNELKKFLRVLLISTRGI
jgi:hypothetical protein